MVVSELCTLAFFLKKHFAIFRETVKTIGVSFFIRWQSVVY